MGLRYLIDVGPHGTLTVLDVFIYRKLSHKRNKPANDNQKRSLQHGCDSGLDRGGLLTH
jgi:hypothetical protein